MKIFEVLRRKFFQRGWGIISAKIRSIRGKWGEEYVWLGALEARLNALWAWVTALWAFVSGWLNKIYAAFVAWSRPIIIWVKAKLVWLLGIYTTYIKPVLDWVNTTVKWLKGLVLLIQGKLDNLIKYVYNQVFGWLEDLRKKIAEIFNTVKDVASIFSKKLADNIQTMEDKFFSLLDMLSRDIRDWAIDSIHKLTDPLVRKTTEIALLLDGYIKKTEHTFNRISDFVAKTFEAPKLLHKDTVELTASRYGMELWESMFKKLVPPLGPGEAKPFPFERLPEWLDKSIENIVKGKEGEWDDVTKRIEEELQEIVTGKEVERKTELTLPGAGGGW